MGYYAPMEKQISPHNQQQANPAEIVKIPSIQESLTYSTKEAATLIGVSRDAIYDLVRRGKLKPLADLRHHRFSKKQILAYLNGGRA